MSLWSWLGLADSEEDKTRLENRLAGYTRESQGDNFKNPDTEAYKSEVAGRMAGVDRRQAPTTTAAGMTAADAGGGYNYRAQYAAPVDSAKDAEYRNGQMALMKQLQTTAAGGGPSMAGNQLKQGTEANIAGGMAMAASAKGNQNPALAMRAAGQNTAAANSSLNQQMANARIQEMLGAQSQLGQVSAAGRSGDQSMANMQYQRSLANAGMSNAASAFSAGAQNQFALANAGFQQQGALTNAGFQQQAGMANLQAKLAQSGMNDAQIRALLGTKIGLSEADRAAKESFAQYIATGSVGDRQSVADARRTDASEGASYASAAGQLLSYAALSSDENAKKNVDSGSNPISAFLSGYSKGSADIDRAAERKRKAAATDASDAALAAAHAHHPGKIRTEFGDTTPDAPPGTQYYTPHDPFTSKEGVASRKFLQAHPNYDQEADLYAKGAPNEIASALASSGAKPSSPSTDLIYGGDVNDSGLDARRPQSLEEAMNATAGVTGTPQALHVGQGFTGAPAGPVGGLPTQGVARPLTPQLGPGDLDSLMQSQYGAQASDERAKKSVHGGEDAITQLLGNLKPHSYEYKEPDKPFRSAGTHYSPMAQEFEKSAVGRSMVSDTPDGKVVDYGKAGGVIFAALAHLEDEVKSLKGARGKAA